MGPVNRKPLSILTLEKRLMLDASLPALTGQVLWLDAADATTVLDADGDNASTGTGGANNGFAGTVATWVDKSGAGFNVTSAGTERPTYGVNTLNSLNTLTLDGVDDRLTNALASIPGDDFTAFIVFRRTTTTGRDAAFEIGGGGSRNALFLNDVSGPNKYNYYLNGSFYNSGTNYTSGTYAIASIMQDIITTRFRVDGNAAFSGFSASPRAATTGIYIGDDSTSGDQLQGNIAEVIIYDRDLTDEEVHDVENYLSDKWALPITNLAPSISNNAGATVLEANTVFLTSGMISATDTDNSDPWLRYKITDAVDHGTLMNINTGLALGVGDSFRLTDVLNGYITYTHDGTPNFTDSFDYTVDDGIAYTAATTFNFTITPANDAPVIQGWTQVASENFEAGASGWSNNFTENGGTYLTRFLGRNSLDGGTQNVFKNYALTGTQSSVNVAFDFYKIDSWDGENFRIFIDDVMVYNASFIQSSFQSPADGSSGAVTWNIQETTPFNANFAFGTWSEQKFHFNLTVASTAANIKIGFSSTLNQAANDEAWGVDNLIIHEVGSAATPGPFTVSERSANGDVVGQVTAIDPDVGDTITYSIVGGTGAGVFAINPSTGVITVANAASLDYEAITSYTLDIQATDNGSPIRFDVETVTINVLDVPENTAPVLGALGPLSVAENAAVNTVIGTMTSTDAESNTVTYSITAGNTDNLFAINPTTGQIRISSTAALNAEWDNSYTLTIQGIDNGFGALSSTRNVVVNITSVNEAPTFSGVNKFLNLDPYLRYNATTGNFYRYSTTSTNLAAANAAAAATLLNGVAGYVATSTTAAENAFLQTLTTTSIWLGGNDIAVEGEWRWAGSGAEAGQMFWLGNAAGSAQNGFYTNWTGGEPNNSGNQDGFQMFTNGRWDDAAVGSNLRYIIEWNGAAVLAALNNGPFTLAENPVLNQSVGFATASDPDVGDTITYSITGGTGSGVFAVNSATGEITVSNPVAVNFESAASYTLDLRVQDVAGLFDTVTVTINISDVNETPVLDTNTGVTLNEGATTVITNAMLSSSDVDAPPDSALVYALTGAVNYGTLRNTNTGLTLGLGDTFTQGDIDNGYIEYTHDGSENLADTFSFTVSDGSITIPASTFNLTMNQVNDAPVIDGWTQVSFEDFQAGAVGWNNNTTEISNPYLTRFLGRASQDGGLQTNFKSYALSGTQDYVVVTLDFYEIDSWDGEAFQIYIDDVLAVSQSFNFNTFEAPASGSAGSVSWTVQRLTPFNANAGFGANNDQLYRYTLTINSTAAAVKLGFGSTLNEVATNEAWGVDNIRIHEVASGGTPGAMDIAENSANGTVVGQITSSDAEVAQTRTYSITGGTGAGVFTIDANTGVITVTNSAALNYEVTPAFTLDITVTDNGTPNLSDTETITINVLNLPENTAPVITPLGPLTVNENSANTTLVGTLAASDAEGNSLTYAITAGNTNNMFAINGAGQITVINSALLNYELLSSYTLTIRVTDNGYGSLFSQTNVTINLNDLNETPSFDPIQSVLNANPSLRYSAATGSFYRLVTGGVNFATATGNAAAMTVNGVGGHIANITSPAENAFLNSMITTSTWIGGSDAAVEGEWRWQGGPEAGQMFWLGNAAGSAQGGFYTNWGGGEPNNSGNEDAVQLLTNGRWNDINAGNALPYLVEWNGAVVIAALQNGPYNLTENAALNASVGFAHASDPDLGDVLTYSITGGTGAGAFAINAATGEITLTNTAAANFELTPSYTLDLRVQDVAGLFDTVTVTINILDANDTPTQITLSNNRITENDPVGTLIGTLTTTDEDVADTHTYSILTNPGNKFTIVGNEIRSFGSIDYEANQNFTLLVRTDDGNGGTYDRSFIIFVNDLADTFTPPPASPPSGPAPSAPSANLDLPEWQDSLVRASLQGGDAGQISAYYGLGEFLQIIRETTTYEVRRLLDTLRLKQDRVTDEAAEGAAEGVGDADQQPVPADVRRLHHDQYTNLREALIQLNQFAREDVLKDSEAEDTKDKQPVEAQDDSDFRPLDRQFVDVMTYHEQREARLRRALLDG